MVEVTLSIYTLRKAKTISFQFVLHFPYFKKEKILSQTLNMGVKKNKCQKNFDHKQIICLKLFEKKNTKNVGKIFLLEPHV